MSIVFEQSNTANTRLGMNFSSVLLQPVKSKVDLPMAQSLTISGYASQSNKTEGGQPLALAVPTQPQKDLNSQALANRLAQESSMTSVMMLIHTLFTEMRRFAAESRQDAYALQWQQLETQAKKIEEAAARDFSGALANGIATVAGGTLSAGAAGQAFSKTSQVKSMYKNDMGPNINSQTVHQARNSVPAETPSFQPNSNLSRRHSAPAGGSSPTGTQPNAQPSTQNNITSPQATEAAAIAKKAITEQLTISANNFANIGQTVTQFGGAVGGMTGAAYSLQADTARADGKRAEAESAKAEADVGQETEFVSKLGEGIRTAQDVLNDLVSLMHQTHDKIWS